MAQEFLGDKVEQTLRTLGAEKAKRIIERVGRRPCGCAGRKEALNRWHKRVLEEASRLKGSNK